MFEPHSQTLRFVLALLTNFALCLSLTHELRYGKRGSCNLQHKKEQSEVKLSFARVGQVVAVRLLRVGSSSGSQAKVLATFYQDL